MTRTHNETPPHARQGGYGGRREVTGAGEVAETPGGAHPRRETARQLRKGQTENRRRARQARRRDVLTRRAHSGRDAAPTGPTGKWVNQRGLHGGRDDPAAAREGVLTDRGHGRAPGAPSGGASQGRARPVTPRQARQGSESR